MSKNDEIERIFSKYLDSENYDRAEEYLFSIIRDAYKAGWSAAEKYYAINNILNKNREKPLK